MLVLGLVRQKISVDPVISVWRPTGLTAFEAHIEDPANRNLSRRVGQIPLPDPDPATLHRDPSPTPCEGVGLTSFSKIELVDGSRIRHTTRARGILCVAVHYKAASEARQGNVQCVCQAPIACDWVPSCSLNVTISQKFPGRLGPRRPMPIWTQLSNKSVAR